jgi:hypothetical protein
MIEMKKIIALVALLSMLLLASATPNNVITGPYNISFDLGLPKEMYNVSISDQKEEESLGGDKSIEYLITIQNATDITKLMDIYITHYDEMQASAIPEEQEYIIRQAFINEPHLSDSKSIKTATRIIDNSTGVIGSADVWAMQSEQPNMMRKYRAVYSPRCDSFSLIVTICSTIPWDEGTLQLLKTIHVKAYEQNGI